MPKKRTGEELKDPKTGMTLRVGEYARPEGGYQYKRWNPDTKTMMRASATTLKELREKEKRIAQDAAAGGRAAGTKNTLDACFRRWKDNKHVKPNVMHNYCYSYEHYVPETLKRSDVKDITHSDILTAYNGLLNNGMGTATLDGVQTVLAQVFRLAVNDGIIFRNPCDGAYGEAVRGRDAAKKREALSVREQARLREVLAEPQNSAWRPLILFLLNTGLRIAECAGLTWDDIDYEREVIHVRRNLKYYKSDGRGHCIWEVSTTKTPASVRDIPLTNDIAGILILQKRDGNECLAEVDGVSGFIFGNRFHEPQHQGTVNAAIRRIRNNANAEPGAEVMLPPFSTHVLRHTFCTNLIYAGVPPEQAAVLMGHSDISTTMNIYNSVQPEQKRAAMEALAELEHRMDSGKNGK